MGISKKARELIIHPHFSFPLKSFLTPKTSVTTTTTLPKNNYQDLWGINYKVQKCFSNHQVRKQSKSEVIMILAVHTISENNFFELAFCLFPLKSPFFSSSWTDNFFNSSWSWKFETFNLSKPKRKLIKITWTFIFFNFLKSSLILSFSAFTKSLNLSSNWNL